MRRKPLPPGLEAALRRGLELRASSLNPTPDPVALARRIEQEEAKRPRSRLLPAAAVVVAAAAVGGGVGAVLVPGPAPQHVSTAAKSGDQAGPLPTGPGKPRSGATAHSSELGLATPGIARVTPQGTHLAAVAAHLEPVYLQSGSSLAGCYKAELVSTAATGHGATGGTTGVVDLQPLAADGLELVDSGTARATPGEDVWWATVAVGSRVARVAAEQPNGAIDAMKPVGGLAVLGGLVPSSSAGGFFSLVAETPGGRPIHSMGFLAGWGPRAWAASEDLTASRTSGCLAAGRDGAVATTLSSQPAAPLLAGSSVIASFHQAYSAGLPAGLAENMAAVRGGSHLLSDAGVAGREIVAASRLAAASARAALAGRVEVSRVAFLSARLAEVVYREAAGGWRTGTAVLARNGLWDVSRASFCGSLGGGTPPSDSALLLLRRVCSKG